MTNGAAAMVRIDTDSAQLEGDLVMPGAGRGLVVFAHGSGSGRHSPRNRKVASVLQEGGLGTLLMDLLTPEEEQRDLQTAELRFNIGLLATRLAAAAEWLASRPETSGLRIGYFGASTGGGAALAAAAAVPDLIGAVVSRGGRPDLAGGALEQVQCPALLIVGGDDVAIAHLNKLAFDRMRCEKRLEIVPGASHLFEEPGALERVADLARGWFQLHLIGRTMGAG